MSTAHDKAERLVRKFHEEMPITNKPEYEAAKQCALICIDEILASNPTYPVSHHYDDLLAPL